tara:strand:- start:412 stop:651 length:240 start_codon:yes stop_codon:yes gene_type:complete
MEYTNYFTPILFIFLTLLLGILIGCIASLWYKAKEMKETTKELDKFRELYFEELDKWKDKYDDDNPDDRFSTRTGALAR